MREEYYVNMVKDDLESLIESLLLRNTIFTTKLFNQTNPNVTFERNVLQETIIQPEYHSKMMMFIAVDPPPFICF